MAQESAVSGKKPTSERQVGEQEAGAGPAEAAGPAGSPRSVSFDRLLSVAVLTPAQAVLIAADLLDAARTPDSDARDDLTGARLGAVALTPSGDVEVGRADADEGTPVGELLARLVHNARRLPAHPKPQQLLLLRRLEEVAEDPSLRAHLGRDLEATLADTLGPDARARLSGQLAALVSAFAHVAPSLHTTASHGAFVVGGRVTPATAAGDGTTSRATGSAARARHPADKSRSVPRRPPRRKGALLHRRSGGRRLALVALVLAAALAVSGYVVLNGPGATFIESFGRDSQPSSPATSAPAAPSTPSAKPAPARQPQAVPSLAARRAGPVTGVVLEKVGSCRPGGVCQVRVTVRFRPASTAQTVGWRVGAARVCRRGIAWSPPTAVTAQPGWTTVYAHSSVRVPRDRSLALVALTTTPARAQSRPVPVTGASSRC